MKYGTLDDCKPQAAAPDGQRKVTVINALSNPVDLIVDGDTVVLALGF